MNTNPNPVSGEGGALPFASLPLWQWAATRIDDPSPMPRAVACLMRRYRLPQTYAALAALHSGLGGREQ